MIIDGFDPKLIAIKDEIEALLEKHGVAGAVQLASSTHAEFSLYLPEWSAIQFERDENGATVGFRLKSSSERDGPGHLESSVHLIFSIRDMVTHHAAGLFTFAEHVSKVLEREGVEIEHETLQEKIARAEGAEGDPG